MKLSKKYLCILLIALVFGFYPIKEKVRCNDYQCKITKNAILYTNVNEIGLICDPYIVRRLKHGYRLFPFGLTYSTQRVAQRDKDLIINGTGNIVRYHYIKWLVIMIIIFAVFKII